MVKELLDLKRASFHLGNAIPFLESCTTYYDLTLCLAFLNHLTDPVGLMKLMAQRSRAIYIWNVTYNERLFRERPEFGPSFGPGKVIREGDLEYTYYPHYYGDVKDYSSFWGGMAPSCCWMNIEDYLGVVRSLGFSNIEYQVDDSPFGDAIRILAVKSK